MKIIEEQCQTYFELSRDKLSDANKRTLYDIGTLNVLIYFLSKGYNTKLLLLGLRIKKLKNYVKAIALRELCNLGIIFINS